MKVYVITDISDCEYTRILGVVSSKKEAMKCDSNPNQVYEEFELDRLQVMDYKSEMVQLAEMAKTAAKHVIQKYKV